MCVCTQEKIMFSVPTGCPTSNRIVIGQKLRFLRLIGKFKKNESF